jgi:hypothetical protein
VWLKLGLSARHVIIWLGNLQGLGLRFWRSALNTFIRDVGYIHLFDRIVDTHDERSTADPSGAPLSAAQRKLSL